MFFRLCTPTSAGWLFKKLYGRLPGESDRAPVYDPDLDAEYRFDVSFVSAGRQEVVSWIKERDMAWIQSTAVAGKGVERVHWQRYIDEAY